MERRISHPTGGRVFLFLGGEAVRLRRLVVLAVALSFMAAPAVLAHANEGSTPIRVQPVLEPSSGQRVQSLLRIDRFLATTQDVVGSRFGGTWMSGTGAESVLDVGVVSPTS